MLTLHIVGPKEGASGVVEKIVQLRELCINLSLRFGHLSSRRRQGNLDPRRSG